MCAWRATPEVFTRFWRPTFVATFRKSKTQRKCPGCNSYFGFVGVLPNGGFWMRDYSFERQDLKDCCGENSKLNCGLEKKYMVLSKFLSKFFRFLHIF